MTEKEILEGNRLIAEFMGGKYDKDTNFPIHPNDIWLPTHGIVNYTTINMGYGKILLYHSSWDWIIPVVEKISKELECKFYLYNRYLKEDHNRQDFLIFRMDTTEILWFEVVEFIKWYNQNKNDLCIF